VSESRCDRRSVGQSVPLGLKGLIVCPFIIATDFVIFDHHQATYIPQRIATTITNVFIFVLCIVYV
jgi:hypothetical protein